MKKFYGGIGMSKKCKYIFLGLIVLLALGCSCTTHEEQLAQINSGEISPSAAGSVSSNAVGDISPDTVGDVLVCSENGHHDFGAVRQKEVLVNIFKLTNKSSHTVRIVSLESSCGCTVAETKDELISNLVQPNSEINFPVSFSSGTAQDKIEGVIAIYYRLDTDKQDDDSVRKLRISVIADILPDYLIEPYIVDFGKIDGLDSQKAKSQFRIIADQLKPLEINSIKPSNDFISAKIISSKDSVYDVEVGLDLSSMNKSQDFFGHLIVETNSKNVPKKIVKISAKYIAPVEVEPSSIIIPSTDEGTIDKTIQISTSVPSELSDIKYNSSKIKITKELKLKSKLHNFKFSVAPSGQTDIDETISFELTLFPINGESVKRLTSISIYRFGKGEKNEKNVCSVCCVYFVSCGGRADAC
jgi:hypothetical protein